MVHRIIDMDDESVTAKGDANKSADEPINISAVKGKVLFWIPIVERNISKTKCRPDEVNSFFAFWKDHSVLRAITGSFLEAI